MLPTKYQQKVLEKSFEIFCTIYGQDSHPEFRIMLFLLILVQASCK